jgi:Protein of unknown function (DUF4238)
MSEPRDHHFIPAFYLRQWATSNNLLCEFSRAHGSLHVKRVGPRGTAFETDLYAFPDLSPKDAHFLEKKFFGYSDQAAAQALEIHLGNSHRSWTAELVTGWSRFLIGIHLRHPDAMPELRAGARMAWDKSGEEHQTDYEKIRKDCDPLLFDDYLSAEDPLTPLKMQLNLIVKALDNEAICTHINAMTYTVIDLSRANNRLLTSDRPVEIFALAAPNGLISMPISPTKLFVAANDDSTFMSLRTKDAETLVRYVNLNVVSRVRKYVWAIDDSQRTFVEKHMSTAMEPLPLFSSMSSVSSKQPE